MNSASTPLTRIRETLNAVIRGKEEAVDLVLTGVLAGGHVLIEDVPGVGKTTLAKALARATGLAFARVQFTPDLLPSDVLGASVLDPQAGSFTFHEGPVFTNLLLADEINRASPRTQSALLEAMNEGQATVDGQTRPLPKPFFVLATQNPVDYQGTYPLPEAQLDRFLVRVSMGYPSAEDELDVLFDRKDVDPMDAVESVASGDDVRELQRRVRQVTVSRDVARYLLAVVHATREHPDLALGVSPRGSLSMFRACQSRALLQGRDWVGPGDIQALATPVLAHRLMLGADARYGGKSVEAILAEVLDRTEVPT